MNTKGFSLIETMVGLFLSLMLAAGIIEYFSSQKLTYRIQSGLDRMQENGNFARHVLQQDIRMAGFQGCPKISNIQATRLTTNMPDIALFNIQNIISGSTGTSSGGFNPAPPAWLISKLPPSFTIKTNTDLIIVRKASSDGANLAFPMQNSDSQIQVTSHMSFLPLRYYIISDCQSADLFQSSAGTMNTIITHSIPQNTLNTLSKAYSTDASVYNYQVYAYYIRDTGRRNQSNAPIYGLFRAEQNGSEEEISEGIESMKVTYGIDSDDDGNVNLYQSAAQVEANQNWGRVISINIHLLANTIENVAEKSQSYNFNQQTLTSSDRLLRREWSIYVRLRNQ